MKLFYSVLFGVVLAAISAVVSAGEMPFNQKVFDELRAAGKPVVVHVHAQWCGTCKVQARVVTPLLSDPEFKDLTLLRADFDKEKALLKTLKVANRSTFVAFKGNTEVGRSTGETNKERIAALLRKAL